MQDQLNNVSPGPLLQDMWKLLEPLQNMPPAHQIAAPAMFLGLLRDVTDLDLPRLFQVVQNMTNDPKSGFFEHFEAARDYIRGEIAK